MGAVFGPPFSFSESSGDTIEVMETTEQQLARLEEKIDAVYKSSEKSRKYLLTMLIGSVLMVVLPLILAALILPFLMSTLGSVYSI